MKKKNGYALLLIALLMAGCGAAENEKLPQDTDILTDMPADTAEETPAPAVPEEPADAETEESGKELPADAEPAAEKNGEICILYTSDVHCGVDQGFGYAGLYQIRQNLEDKGYTTILVDDGDSIQGEAMGTLTKGEANVKLMNAVGYDVAIPGNHEFDYSMDRFLELTQMADYKYISCNLNKDGELLLDPYTIVDACGIKIGFVGITTPESLTSSSPVNFQDESGKTIYDFKQDKDGSRLYEAVQEAVDAVRADGADYVYVMAHLGMESTAQPWTYADVISHTDGIDVFLDGHSHDVEQVVMKNKDGENVIRSAVGTKMHCIGYSFVSKEGIGETDIWSWNNETDAPGLLGIDNEVARKVDETKKELEEILSAEVADIPYDLTDCDPVEKDAVGKPLRMVRRGETNLGDLAADAIREAGHADIGLINGGGIRAGIGKGKVTYGDIIKVFPFNNDLCVVEAGGQQILDALEWAARGVPEENGAFLHVSGMTYEIDPDVPSPCKADENGMMTAIKGKRRVKNVMVGDEPIDPKAKYRVAGTTYTLLDNGDGSIAFDGAELLENEIMLDNQALIQYITQTLGGDPGEAYADPYGQGRIVIAE